VLSIW
jgi:hypothetical protein